MRNTKRLTLLIAAVLAVGFGIPAEPAEASHGWRVGSSFSVGRFDFGVFYQPGSRSHDYYYRTAHSPRYGGYRCHDRCYRDRGFDYHYSSCPLVHHHFRRHSFSPGLVLDLIFGPSGYWGYRDYRGHRRYDHYRHHDHLRYRYDGRRYGSRYDGRRHRSRYDSRRHGSRYDSRHRSRFDDHRRYRYDDDSDSDSDRRYRGRRDSRDHRGDRYRSDRGQRRGRDTRSRHHR